MKHKSRRCKICFWALYDGEWCQNKDCVMRGKSLDDSQVVELTNEQAAYLIAEMKGQMDDSTLDG